MARFKSVRESGLPAPLPKVQLINKLINYIAEKGSSMCALKGAEGRKGRLLLTGSTAFRNHTIQKKQLSS